MIGGGPFSLPSGYWTDDTSMALCLADSLIEKGFDTKDQMNRYIQWYEKGYRSSTGSCFDIGRTTLRSLALYRKTGDPNAGVTGDQDSGNGALMRLAPVILWGFKQRLDCTIEYAVASTKTTHGNTECLQSSAYLAEILFYFLSGSTKEAEFIASNYFAQIAEAKIKDRLSFTPDTAPNSGYVFDTLKSALWAFDTTDDFEQVIQLGGDADTLGAVYGQIAGAYYGLEAIPERWRRKLHLYEEMLHLVEKLLEKGE